MGTNLVLYNLLYYVPGAATIICSLIIVVSMIKLWIYVRNVERKRCRHDFEGVEVDRGQSTLAGRIGVMYSGAYTITIFLPLVHAFLKIEGAAPRWFVFLMT